MERLHHAQCEELMFKIKDRERQHLQKKISEKYIMSYAEFAELCKSVSHDRKLMDRVLLGFNFFGYLFVGGMILSFNGYLMHEPIVLVAVTVFFCKILSDIKYKLKECADLNNELFELADRSDFNLITSLLSDPDISECDKKNAITHLHKINSLDREMVKAEVAVVFNLLTNDPVIAKKKDPRYAVELDSLCKIYPEN